MNRIRFLIVALSTLALASMTSAASPIDTPSAGRYCDKLCIIGYHCVATANGGVCVKGNGVAEATPTDSTDLTATGKYCNKLCIIGYHCVATGNGGVCVKGSGAAEATPTETTETTAVISDQCAANASDGAYVAKNDPPPCGACTILCPIGTHLVQKGNCDCRCVGNSG